MTDQLTLEPEQLDVSKHRVRALAGVLAGFRWPERGSFEKLTKRQKEITLNVAADALGAMMREPE
jgi:hypothetical protein